MSNSISYLSSHISALTLCRHFGTCGGCQIQDLPYDSQLQLKQKKLQMMMAPFWKEALPVHPSPEIYYYRNKMEFSFGKRIEGITLGLKKKKRWDTTLDIEECHLLSAETAGLLKAVREWMAVRGLVCLRYLVVREGKNTDQRMVFLHSSQEISNQEFVQAVRPVYPATTILWGMNTKLADVAVADRLEVLFGSGFIEEKLGGLLFRISPTSFFQTNTKGAERLYAILRNWISEAHPELLLDLYGGCGGISFSAAEIVQQIVCVESSVSAVADARFNAQRNDIHNVEFVCAKTEDFLSSPTTRHLPLATVVLDPPRAGLHPKALKSLISFGPARIVYVSCNPRALAQDLKELLECYKIDRIEALDLFPHTEHIEVLVQLKKS
ncbi:MAG: 23S rRNA (uracil(1939)-C(5))-methyltransferase RlmD [Elusimicrobia bacterium]|nr:23S rRNA (uracil(1939)-C(5))-methyltransferase RlmD [Elusimicrobiota bacterium]